MRMCLPTNVLGVRVGWSRIEKHTAVVGQSSLGSISVCVIALMGCQHESFKFCKISGGSCGTASYKLSQSPGMVAIVHYGLSPSSVRI